MKTGKPGVFVTRERNLPYYDNPFLQGRKFHHAHLRKSNSRSSHRNLVHSSDAGDYIRLMNELAEGRFMTSHQLYLSSHNMWTREKLYSMLQELHRNNIVEQWKMEDGGSNGWIKYTAWSLTRKGYALLMPQKEERSIVRTTDDDEQMVQQLQKYAALNQVRISLRRSQTLIKWNWSPEYEDGIKARSADALLYLQTPLGLVPFIIERVQQNSQLREWVRNRMLFWNRMIDTYGRIPLRDLHQNGVNNPIIVWSCGSDSIINEAAFNQPECQFTQLWLSDEKIRIDHEGLKKSWLQVVNNQIYRVILPV